MTNEALDGKPVDRHVALHVESHGTYTCLQHLPDYYQLDAKRAGSGTPFPEHEKIERPGQQGSKRDFARSWN